jgi:zinc and cadmium transporter
MNTTISILGSVVVVSLVSFTGIFVMALKRERLVRMFSFLVPLAVGALFGDAFFHLIPESFKDADNPLLPSLFLTLGIISFFSIEKVLHWHYHGVEEHAAAVPRRDARHLGPLILISDGFHNFIDGVIIAVSYLAGLEVGVATTLAVVLHEIPQEIGDFSVLLYAGYERRTALFYNFLSALTAVAGAVIILLFDALPEALLQGVMPFIAGVFIYIAGSDLVPELHKNGNIKTAFTEVMGMGLGFLVMYLLLFLE